MAKVGVVTDTVACLPPEKVKEYGIGIVPIALNINGKAYLDQVDMNPDEFWKIFKDIKEFTTGAPSLGEYTKVFNEVAKSTNDIVCTFVSKALSGIYETAVQAIAVVKKENPKLNIEIIDSKTAAGAQAFAVLEMARAAQAGKSIDEVVKAGRDMLPKAKFFCGMETLKYLIKSGRAPKTAYMGEVFQVKPIIGMTNGSGVVENIARARGKPNCMAKMVELIKDYTDTTRPLHIMAHYTDDIEDGKRLMEMVTAKYKCEEVYLTQYTPVMSGHTGPVFAVSFYS
ncbi:MAG: DegV family protein [Chloroflexota bacterium]